MKGEFSKEDDRKMYQKVKNIKTLSQYKEKGLVYYVMNAEWILSWHMWMGGRKGAKYPGKVRNKSIAEKIMNQRKKDKHLLHDNNVKFKQKNEVSFCSEVFFKAFS